MAGDLEALDSIGSSASSFLFAGTMATLVMNIFMAISIRLVWKMLGAIQLIVHMPLLNISLPANATYVYNAMMDLVNFKLLDVSYLMDKLFGL